MLEIHEIPALDSALRSLSPGEPIVHGSLTVVPLLDGHGPAPDWLTLAEAGDAVSITEVDDAGDVPTLRITNDAGRPVIVLDGDELLGAKQNRILNTTVLVAAKAATSIPVSCVEQGRWAYRGRRARPSDYSLYASLRRKKAARVSDSIRARGRHDSDQGEVWNELAAKAERLGVDSRTGAMHAVYTRYADEVQTVRDALPAGPHQVGALIYIAGEWVGLDVLAAPALFARAWSRLSTGYIADAIDADGNALPRVSPAEVLTRVAAARLEKAPTIGLGVEYRLDGKEATGAALVVDDLVAHLAAFPPVVD